MALHQMLRKTAQHAPSKPALISGDQCWTYAEADDLTDRMAASLVARGIRPGDRVALLFANVPEMVFSYFACFKAGAVAVPINTRFQVPETLYVLNHSEAKLLIGQSDMCGPLFSLRTELPRVERVFVNGEFARTDWAGSFSELCFEPISSIALAAPEDEQLAALLYTSGTTARPKGVMHTHATLECLADDLVTGLGRDVMERAVISTPLCHISGIFMLLATMEAGGAAWILRFEPEAVLRALTDCRATYFFAVPAHLNSMVHHPAASRSDLRSLRSCGCGGDSIPLELHNRFREVFGVRIDEGCGMTEIIYSFSRPPDAHREGSFGKPLPSVRLRIVNDERIDLPRGDPGEVLVQSRGVTPGYWKDPEATASAIQDGWMQTGDLARQDEDGFYWFVGRKKDIIIRGGSNIAPAEVEDVLCRHPAVQEAGVVGIPDAVLGQTVRAFVSLRHGAQATEAELRTFAGESIGAYKVPERIFFLDELPKGPTGKIFRRGLRERLCDA